MAMSRSKKLLQKTGFLKEFRLKGLSDQDFAIVDRYGSWLSALETGKIAPETEAQDHFLRVCRHEEEATSLYEKAWVAYKAVVYFDEILTKEILEPVLAGRLEVISGLKDRGLPSFAFDNIVFRLRQEEECAETSSNRSVLQKAVIKVRNVGRKGSANRYGHTNYGGFHNYGL